MFEIADKVVYGETGVCIIEDICEKEFIKNQKMLYYVLRPVQSNSNLIYAPAQNCKIAMRNIISKKEAEELIQSIPTIVENMTDSTEQTLQDYKAQIIAHSPQKLIELTATIYNKKRNAEQQKKRLNAIDEKYMKIAENLLFGELAEVLEISIQDVPKYISQKVK